MPPHRDLGGERGSERGEAGQAGVEPNPTQPPETIGAIARVVSVAKLALERG
jgi:hypothetical protein